jgi:hypothetical protein
MKSAKQCRVLFSAVMFAAICLIVFQGTPAHGLRPVPGYGNGNTQFGSIAYSKSTGRSGYSYGYSDLNSANNDARSRCGQDDCEVMVVFWNGCGALAKGSDGSLGWGTAGSRAGAESRALQECNSSGSNCEIVCWACSGN